MTRMHVVAASVALAMLASFGGFGRLPRVRAGGRAPGVLFVRADDGSDPSSGVCAATIRRELDRSADGLLQSMSPTVAASRLGATSLDGFVTLPKERLFEIIPVGQMMTDALVILDCRPQRSTLDAVVLAGTGGRDERVLQRIQLRHVRVDAAGARTAATILRHWVWTNFSP